MMTCALCASAGHIYDRSCLGCAARLVASARPGRRQQDAMLVLAWIERGGIERLRVIDELQRRGAQRELAELNKGTGA